MIGGTIDRDKAYQRRSRLEGEEHICRWLAADVSRLRYLYDVQMRCFEFCSSSCSGTEERSGLGHRFVGYLYVRSRHE